MAAARAAVIGAAIGLSMLAFGCRREKPRAVPEPVPATERTLAQGALVGAAGPHGGHVWRGIPYAKPPVGELRWRAPLPPDPWTGTLAALEDGPACMQFATRFGGPRGEEANAPMGSEDCLTLSIYGPAFAPDAVPTGEDRLPVMVWIHGGGNTIGSKDVYDGSLLASRRDVFVVALNYRLGAFGWFAHPALRGDGTNREDRSGNYGTLDLIRGLAWVRDNVAAFGGDPDNVTIFGESAGGNDVVTLLVSPLARTLFHRAIVQSGGMGSVSVAEAENFEDADEPGHARSSREVLVTLLVSDGAPDRATARAKLEAMSDPEIAAYLRAKSPKEVLGAYDNGGRLGGMYFLPTIIRDGWVLPAEEFPLVFEEPDGTAPVPVVLGTNRDENKLFMLFLSDDVRRLFGLPLWAKDQAAYDLEAEYQSNMWKADAADGPARALRARGEDAYVYRFDWDEEPRVFTADMSKLLGAAHAFEIPFVFGTFDLGPANRFLWDDERIAERDALSDAMMSYWTEFAYRGAPGRGRDGDLPDWKRWDTSAPDAPKFLVLDTPEDGGVRMSSDAVAAEALIARIETDDRFDGIRDRCAVYRRFVEWGDRISEEHYRTLAGGACGAFPID